LANVLDSVYLSVDRRAVVTAAKLIIASEVDIVVAGGSENMDRARNLTDGGSWGYEMGPARILNRMLTDSIWGATMRILVTLTLLILPATALASPSCKDGFQPRGDACVSQEMSRYIACVEASGGKRQEIDGEIASAVTDNNLGEAAADANGIVLKGGGSVELNKNVESIIAEKLIAKNHGWAMMTCAGRRAP
jgi:hypothetical protein